MNEHKYGVQLRHKRNYYPVIKFNTLKERKELLSLLNNAKINSQIILFEDNREEK